MLLAADFDPTLAVRAAGAAVRAPPALRARIRPGAVPGLRRRRVLLRPAPALSGRQGMSPLAAPPAQWPAASQPPPAPAPVYGPLLIVSTAVNTLVEGMPQHSSTVG